jgi:hypothetical protein
MSQLNQKSNTEVMYSDDDIIISLEYLVNTNIYIVHTKVSKWSLSKYKKYVLEFANILNTLKLRGIEEVFTIPPTDKIEKWQRLFGFIDSGYRPKGYKLMVIKT